MKTGKKLIIYTDGSYAYGKSGWAFHISCNEDNASWVLGYGSYASKGSSQSELYACLESLNYWVKIEDERFNDIEVIEIRSDFLELVKFINHHQKSKFEYRLVEGNYSCYTSELLSLLEIIKKLPVELRAKKVNNKDLNLLKVHKMAKYSLYELPNDLEKFYLETSDNQEKRFLNKKDNICRETIKEPKVLDKQNWYDYIDTEIIFLPVDKISIEEDIHLKSKKMNFNGTLKEIKEHGSINKPIAVRKNGENYILVAGMNRLCAAKLLGFKKIPAVVQEGSHLEFLLRYII